MNTKKTASKIELNSKVGLSAGKASDSAQPED